MKKLKDIAEEFGVTLAPLVKMGMDGKFQMTKVGRHWMVDNEDADYLCNMLGMPKLADYADNNHPKSDKLRKLCRDGYLHSVRFGNEYRLYMDAIEDVKRVIDWYDIAEVGRKTGIKNANIKMMARKNFITSRKIGGRYYFNNDSLNQLKQYKKGLTKKEYCKKYKISEYKLNLIMNGLDTFSFGKRIMIKDS